MRPTHLLLPLLLLLVSGPGPSLKPAAAARHSRIELTTAAATPEAAAAAVASDNLAELQAVVMQPTVAAAAAMPASDETKRTDDGGSNKASDPSLKNDQSSYVANAGGAGAGSTKLADGKYKQYLAGIAYPLRRRLTTSLLFPLTDANRGAAAGGVVVAQQLKKEQKQQPAAAGEQDEEAGEAKEGLLSADYERISPATLASQQHHHNSIDECDPDLLGFEIITG